MMLIGQYDSPFVRRVAIALKLYGLPVAHKPWSVFSDADAVGEASPLTRVPVLVLDDGETILDSHAILDHLDGLVAPGRRLIPQAEPARRRALRIVSLATGLSDKAVALFYEERLHAEPSELWRGRCRGQIAAALAALEAERASCASAFWFGAGPGHADIAVAASLRHLAEAHPGLAPGDAHPALAAHCARAEALPVFREISQPFIAPA